MSPSWKPKRTGEIYCSPACGANCTRADYDAAKREAKALANAFGASGFEPNWKPLVWENLGWHWSIVSAEIEVHALKSDGKVTGYYASSVKDGSWRSCSRSPKGAIRNMLAKARQSLHDAMTVVVACQITLR